MMVGRELTDFYKHEVSTTLTPNRFVVNQITDGKRVKPTSFSVAGGEILALSGLVGVGSNGNGPAYFGADKSTGGEGVDRR